MFEHADVCVEVHVRSCVVFNTDAVMDQQRNGLPESVPNRGR